MLVEISKHKIAHEICGHLCMMVESLTCSGSFKLQGDRFVLVKKWEQKEDGSWRALCVNASQLVEGYNCYAGFDSEPERTRIPSFISNDWEKAQKIFMKLKLG